VASICPIHEREPIEDDADFHELSGGRTRETRLKGETVGGDTRHRSVRPSEVGEQGGKPVRQAAPRSHLSSQKAVEVLLTTTHLVISQ
jgi:hypothetical protein